MPLLHDEGSRFTINRSRIACHLALAEADPTSTWFNEIHQVRPMHRVFLDGNDTTEQRHQSFDYLPMDHSIGIDEYCQQLLSKLDDAVGPTIRAPDDPVALAISGGMDSTAVAASIMNTRDAESQGVSLYSWQFPEYPECDETRWVSDLAAQYHVDWHPVICTACEPLGQAFDDIDIPLIAPSIDAYRALRKRLSDQVSRDGHRQLVTGDFGDHLYMGQHYCLQDARKAGESDAWQAIRNAIRQHGLKGFRRQAAMRRLLPFNGLSRRFRKHRAEWLTLMANRLLNSGVPSYINPVRQPDRIEACLSPTAADAARYGLSLSQSWGLPHRYPLRDPALIRFMLSLPAYLLTDPLSRQSKWIMRQAMSERLPSSITMRQGKTTFEPIFTEGVLHRHREKTRLLVNHPNAAWPDYIDHDWLQQQAESMQFSYTGLVVLWQIISLQLWIDELPANISA